LSNRVNYLTPIDTSVLYRKFQYISVTGHHFHQGRSYQQEMMECLYRILTPSIATLWYNYI